MAKKSAGGFLKQMQAQAAIAAKKAQNVAKKQGMNALKKAQNVAKKQGMNALKKAQNQGKALANQAKKQGMNALGKVQNQGKALANQAKKQGMNALGKVQNQGKALAGQAMNQGKALAGQAMNQGRATNTANKVVKKNVKSQVNFQGKMMANRAQALAMVQQAQNQALLKAREVAQAQGLQFGVNVPTNFLDQQGRRIMQGPQGGAFVNTMGGGRNYNPNAAFMNQVGTNMVTQMPQQY